MSTTIEFRFKPQGETLEEYMSDRGPVTCIMGPLGSGKTYGSCQRIFAQMCEQPANRDGVRKSRWFAVRNTYPDLQSTTIKDWREMFDSFEGKGQALGRFTNDFPPTHHLKFRLQDGTRVESELVFLALDRPDSVRKLRGAQATGFWLNEMKELDKEIVDMCDLRHGRYPSRAEAGDYWHGMIGDTNAPDDDHWYHELAEKVKPEGWKFLRQPGGVVKEYGKWVINPDAENLNNLPEDYYKRGMQGKSDDWIRVNLGNEYGTIITGKPIYEGQWNDKIHVSEFPLTFARTSHNFAMGFDFGLTPSCIFGQVMPNGQLRVITELVAERMGIEAFSEEVVLPFFRSTFGRMGYNLSDIPAFCDPAGLNANDNNETTAIGILVDKGFDAVAAPSNNPTARWEAVRWYLTRLVGAGQPGFLLNPECRILRKGFNGGYQFKRLNVSGGARYAEKANKNEFSHPHDALQYLCAGLRGSSDGHFKEAPRQRNSYAGDPVTAY